MSTGSKNHPPRAIAPSAAPLWRRFRFVRHRSGDGHRKVFRAFSRSLAARLLTAPVRR